MKFKPKQIREMSEIQLNKTLQDLQGALRKNRFLAGHGELKKVHQIKEIKKSIARVKTELANRAAGVVNINQVKDNVKVEKPGKKKVTVE